MPDRFVLVLAGGRGERFWPWSRPARPKQLLPLARDGRSLLASTFERALRLVPSADHVLVMTALDLKEAVRSECPGARVLGEPVGRNTAPAIAAAAAWIPVESAFAVLPEFAGLGFSVGRALPGLAGCLPTPHDVRQWLYRVATSTEQVGRD